MSKKACGAWMVSMIVIGCGSDSTGADAGSYGSFYQSVAEGGNAPADAAWQSEQSGSDGGLAGASGGGAAGVGGGAAGASGSEPSATDGGAGKPAMDAALDGSVAGQVADAGGAADDSPPEAGTLPDICYNNQECRSVSGNTVCFGEGETGPGYCTDTCVTDAQCGDIEGLPSDCSQSGACYLPCDAQGADGCPESMVCDQIQDGAYELYACIYPPGAFEGESEIWESCDVAHGDDDCAGDLVCYRPAGFGGMAAGFCTRSCDNTLQCPQPAVITAEVECNSEDLCVLDCSSNGATCLEGMVCRKLGQGANDPRICSYPSN